MIKVKDLAYSYNNSGDVIKGLNFSVERGEIFGFLGPNGSGKSTTQKILIGILNGYRGDVNVGQYSMRKVSKDYYQMIGVLFELPYLYSTLSAVDNLKYFSSFYQQNNLREIDKLLDLVELKRDYRQKQIKQYSKGMKQRVSIARTLINNPQILFLDEPVSGVDPVGAMLIKNIIKREKEKGTTIFLTTHNMFVADELCDRVAFIAEGEIKVIDTPKNLKSLGAQNQVEIEYIKNGEKRQRIVNFGELKSGLSFEYDNIVTVHSKESTLEDVFIQLTGRRLN